MVKYLVAIEMPRVRFPDGALSYAPLASSALLANWPWSSFASPSHVQHYILSVDRYRNAKLAYNASGAVTEICHAIVQVQQNFHGLPVGQSSTGLFYVHRVELWSTGRKTNILTLHAWHTRSDKWCSSSSIVQSLVSL